MEFILIFLFVAFVLFYNYIVWAKPDAFMKYVERGRPQDGKKTERQKIIWAFIESPQYIWYIRFVAFIPFVAIAYLIADYFGLI